jgi:oligopeptide transport system substrate-binding protein
MLKSIDNRVLTCYNHIHKLTEVYAGGKRRSAAVSVGNIKKEYKQMKRTIISVVALLLAAVVMLPMFAACKKTDTPATTTTAGDTTVPDSGEKTYEKVVFDKNKSYIYKDTVSVLSANWNPHTYQTTDESYPADFLRVGLYGFVFNDALHPSTVEGVKEYEGYTIIPEMAAAMPEDITEEVKALDNNKYGIPESATTGYAYKIKLNEKATWEDGTAINADTYIYSMKQLLNPDLLNYRATDYYAGSFSIAGAENYACQGQSKYNENSEELNKSDLTKGDDGCYYTADGSKVYIAVGYGIEWCNDYSLKDYVEAYGDAYFATETWDALVALMDDNGLVPLTDESYDLFLPVITGNAAWGETEENAFNYFIINKSYADGIDFDTVGIYKTGDYEIVLVLKKSLSGFYLLYNLTGNWIVKEDLYESCLTKDEATGVWSTTYNTNVETTSSYGPYKLVEYVTDQSMRFVKNDAWYGYTDGQHTYVDPEDGKEYDMYMTTEITTQVVSESSTIKNMFLKGQVMTYGLQSDDFAQYRDSDYCYFTPSETIFFFIFNGNKSAIEEREAADDFDTTKYDLQTMILTSFRKAVAVTYDKEALCSAVSPSRSGGYGLIGNSYIYDPETGAKYRDTDYAKQALCDFYSVDVSKYESLDAAVDSITGYDPEAAKELYTQAFNEALAAGYITSADGKTCDQTIQITYAMSSDSDFMTKTINYLNEKMAEVTKGTPFEGKIVFVKSAELGDDWSTAIKSGTCDTVLAGWSGSALDPYGLSDLYCNPNYAYDAKWFDATKVDITITINGEELTMTLYQWSDALNGTAVTVNGKEYNFGDGFADVDTRLLILSKIETTVLNTYDYIPMLQNASAALLSRQVYYVIEDYSPVMGRGGIAYLKYNYDETEWQAFIAEQENGEIPY